MLKDEIEIVDLRGYQCPLPVLKTRNRMRKLAEGERIEIITDDPLAGIDIPAYCNEYQQGLISQQTGEGDEHRFVLERRGSL